jgi:hypothetical protein
MVPLQVDCGKYQPVRAPEKDYQLLTYRINPNYATKNNGSKRRLHIPHFLREMGGQTGQVTLIVAC